MGLKTPPHDDYPQWTTARFWTFMRSAIRQAWNKWPPKYEALERAKRVVTGKRHKYEYQCAACQQWFKQKEVQVDHIHPAGGCKNWAEFMVFASRTMVSVNKLQVLCKSCHQIKTNKERGHKQDECEDTSS